MPKNRESLIKVNSIFIFMIGSRQSAIAHICRYFFFFSGSLFFFPFNCNVNQSLSGCIKNSKHETCNNPSFSSYFPFFVFSLFLPSEWKLSSQNKNKKICGIKNIISIVFYRTLNILDLPLLERKLSWFSLLLHWCSNTRSRTTDNRAVGFFLSKTDNVMS